MVCWKTLSVKNVGIDFSNRATKKKQLGEKQFYWEKGDFCLTALDFTK
jgi:hypothetical protein